MAKVRVNWGPLPEGQAVRMYRVYNTSHDGIFVLAANERDAMSIAHTANHIYGTSTIIAESYNRMAYEITEPFEQPLRDHWGAVQRAITQRLQGTVHFDGGHVLIGNEVL